LRKTFCLLGGWLGLALAGAGVWIVLPRAVDASPRSRRDLG
jgi:hypothetical protein